MLYQASGELMSAETPDVVARRGVDAACNTLGLSIAAVFLESRGVLEPVASSEQATEPCGDPDPVTARESMAWEIHESETPATATNPDQARSIWSEDCSCDVSAALLVPLSGHGILFIGAQPDDSFDDETRALAQILGSNIETTLDRVAKEQDLRDREQELAQQNERLESFTSVVSHDLRNPLSVAKGYAEIAKEETESDAVGRIDRSLNRMDTLIEDLLTMARQGETIDELEPMDLEHVARDAWSTVKTGAATLRVDGNMEFEGDPNRSRQLLENLFRNAVEHGGMDVTVTVGSLGDDGIFIEDTGSGIPLEDRGAVFEQGYTTTETGTGFGLAIVETIVNAHDGSATVTKGREGGARFEITGLDAGDG
jgi:signal transduction histidine kinase